jgi:hypothetical protein
VVDSWDKDHATNKAVAEELDIDKAAAFRRVKTATGRGYLENLEDRKGRPMRLVLGEKMPDDREILPAAGELEESSCTVDRDFGGTNHPPLPSDDDIKGGGSCTPPNNTSIVQPREEFVL